MDLGFIVHHGKHTEDIHKGREYGDKHDFGIGNARELCHDKAPGTHDGRHEHTRDGGSRLDSTGNMRLEAGLFHHGNGEGTGGNRVGNGAS